MKGMALAAGAILVSSLAVAQPNAGRVAAIGFDAEKNETTIGVQIPEGLAVAELKKLPQEIPAKTFEVKSHGCPEVKEVKVGNHVYASPKGTLDFPAEKFSKLTVTLAEPAKAGCEVGVVATASDEDFENIQWPGIGPSPYPYLYPQPYPNVYGWNVYTFPQPGWRVGYTNQLATGIAYDAFGRPYIYSYYVLAPYYYWGY